MMHGYMGQAAQLKRDAGAHEVLAAHPGLKLLAAQSAEWDRAKAVTLMENWLQSHGDRIDAIFAQNDEMAMGALLAIEVDRQFNLNLIKGVSFYRSFNWVSSRLEVWRGRGEMGRA